MGEGRVHTINIEVRERGQHHGNPSQLKYGMKRKAKNSAIHQGEQRTVDTVRQMKEEGLSLRAIARCLNQMKIPTKNRGVKWHPQMISRLLSRKESAVKTCTHYESRLIHSSSAF